MSQDIRPTFSFHHHHGAEKKQQPSNKRSLSLSEFSENLILFSAQHTDGSFFSARALCDKRQEVALMG